MYKISNSSEPFPQFLTTSVNPNWIFAKFVIQFLGMNQIVSKKLGVKKKQNIWILLINLIFVLLLAGCAAKSVPSSNRTGNYNDYSEDLSNVRPTYVPTSTTVSVKVAVPNNTTTSENIRKSGIPSMSTEAQHVNKRLDEAMEVIANQNRSVRYAPGYRIQIYSGNERQRAEAAKMLIYQNFPELNTYLSYKQPTYRLKVGDFMRRIDAERYFSQLKVLFSTAALQTDKIDIRRSLAIN